MPAHELILWWSFYVPTPTAALLHYPTPSHGTRRDPDAPQGSRRPALKPLSSAHCQSDCKSMRADSPSKRLRAGGRQTLATLCCDGVSRSRWVRPALRRSARAARKERGKGRRPRGAATRELSRRIVGPAVAARTAGCSAKTGIVGARSNRQSRQLGDTTALLCVDQDRHHAEADSSHDKAESAKHLAGMGPHTSDDEILRPDMGWPGGLGATPPQKERENAHHLGECPL